MGFLIHQGGLHPYAERSIPLNKDEERGAHSG